MPVRSFDSELKTHLVACRAALKYVVFFSALSNLLMLVVPVYSLQVLDRVLSSGSMDTLLMLTLVVLAALAGLTLLQTARSVVALRVGEWLESRLAPAVVEQAVSAAAYVAPASSGQGLRDLSALKGFLTGPVFAALLDVPWTLLFAATLFFIHPWVGTLTVWGGMTLLFLALLEEKINKNEHAASSKLVLSGFNQLEMAVRNAEAAAAMGMLPQLLARWRKTHGEALDLDVRTRWKAVLISSASRFVRLALQVAIIGVCAWLTLQNALTAGAIIASSILAGRALAPLESVISGWGQISSARAAYKRLHSQMSHAPLRDEEIQLPCPKGELIAEQVAFAPPGVRSATLRNVTFRLAPGEMLGVIGPSGSGKSTLGKLLVGVWKPVTGAVRLDGADVWRWAREDFGRHAGYVPQDIELFSGTVKENIARMDPGAPDEAVVRAAEQAGAHGMILQLPRGYETDIGPGGAMLSGGQRQRIALARAFYGSPRLVVLDEPNSNLDNDGEIALLSTLRRAKEAGITVVMVSHRPSLMTRADRILLLRDGEMAAFGKREEVFAMLNPPKITDISQARRAKLGEQA